ncbi:MAG TPA: UvrD-helicase domain-containing protein [Acidimicrobiales bacterium]|nr:UvrD-helicase domain-containing protein [Acidimicrobiales bacterium]
MAAHPDLQAEQAHIDRAYDRVEALRAAANELLETVLRQRGGTPGSFAERDVVVRTTLQRLEQLDVGRESLCFGRIDRADGDTFHIGRLAVSGEDQEPLVVDWRAPVAEPFYRATGVDTMGLVRRRHFASEGRRLIGIEDEVFGVLDGAAYGAIDGDGSDGDGRGSGELATTGGTGTLLSALERARSGRMRDIVATVQKEQDEVIRADLGGVLVVQGGPGTGKTAVALHRAAYLLYTHRFPLERQGVLVVGPNPLFLRYIEQVLPSLGENGVVLSTIAGLVPDARVRAVDPPLAASVKSDPRMARLVANAVADRQRPLSRTVEVGFEGFLLRITPDATERIVSAARRRPGSHNARRRQVEGLLSRLLHQQYRHAAERRMRAGFGRILDLDELDGEDGGDERGEELASGEVSETDLWGLVRELPAVASTLDRIWPVLTPEELVHDLFGAPALVRLAARGLLDDEERAALVRPRSETLDEIPWTAGDLPLLDEARVLLGPRRPGAKRSGEIRQYGHIVVDEAQDLTPMQLRMLARRSLSGSMTVAGDIAQATGPRALSRWEEVTSFLPSLRPARVVELSVNYRTPSEVMALAGRVLAVTAPDLQPPLSVRSTGDQPVFVAAPPDGVAERAAELAAGEARTIHPGTVALVVPPTLVGPVEDALAGAGTAFGSAERDGIDATITVIPVGMVKGLEFDSVIVVEPARIVAESPQGLRALYVALTRATRRLSLVHAEPLPEMLATAG